MLVNIHRSVTATSKPEDYDSFVMPLSHFLTLDALPTPICTIYTLIPSVMVTNLLWAQLTPTHELFITRTSTLGVLSV